jgi:type II secretory pathway pseudopilin PulG
MIIRKQKAYTLLELIVILIIIGILSVLAIPSFMNYGKKQALSQKADEVKQLIDQAHILSQNPEKDALSYEVFADKGSSPNKFVLKKCKANIQANFRCNSDSAYFDEIKTVSLFDGQIIQDPTNDSYLACPGGPKGSCQSTIITIFDSNITTRNTISYTIKTPFSVSYDFLN